MPPSSIPIETQKVSISLPKLVMIIGAVSMFAATAAVAYAQLATVAYVDNKHQTVTQQIGELAKAQKATSSHIDQLTEQKADTDRRLALVVKLVSAQYIEHINEYGASRRGNKPLSPQAQKAAAMLQIDPDDPLAGIDLVNP